MDGFAPGSRLQVFEAEVASGADVGIIGSEFGGHVQIGERFVPTSDALKGEGPVVPQVRVAGIQSDGATQVVDSGLKPAGLVGQLGPPRQGGDHVGLGGQTVLEPAAARAYSWWARCT